jgi:hypothetical protein
VGLKPLGPPELRRLEALRNVARLLDSAFRIPGTTYRIGLDPILGFLPGFGDLVSPLFALAIVWNARTFGVPRIVVIRMLVNVAIDAVLGAVPLIGDLFDFTWKANSMNLALLERHAAGERAETTGDWVFVGAVMLILMGIAALPFLLIGWLAATLL